MKANAASNRLDALLPPPGQADADLALLHQRGLASWIPK